LRKRQHRIFAVILVGLITIAMVGSGFAMFFSGSGIQIPNQNSTANTTNSTADYQAKKVRLAELSERAKSDTGNVALQTDLGNEYYDAGLEAETAAPAESSENYKHAVEAYQNVLKVNKDANVMVDLATAAFKSGQNDLAEKTYQEALTMKPDFLNGLVNYGVFLETSKKDFQGAITQWQKALKVAQDGNEKTQINSMIDQAQSQLKGTSNTAATGISNPNPALKNGTAAPAPSGK
jgi:tetratricopeptide (TPR) repeat protein